MFFNSYLEFLAIVVFIVLYNVIRRLTSKTLVFRILLLVGNALLLSILIEKHTLIVLAILSFLVFGITWQISRASREKRWRFIALTMTLLVLVALFCIRNYAWFQSAFGRFDLSSWYESITLVQRIGLSYILFRLLHFSFDAYRKKIPRFDPLVFLNYIFFFPTFLAGPIDRYQNFLYWSYKSHHKFHNKLLLAGVGRVFIGAAKRFILVPLVITHAINYVPLQEALGSFGLGLFVSLLAYSAYIYLDFSGYSDIAIGTAYLIGIKTPENFQSPYLSTNIRDFWQRWHITFSSILGEYIFRPFVKLLSKLLPMFPRLSISIIGYLYTFVICGIWHGSTMNFVWWGLWHGIGLSIYKAWDLLVTNKGWMSNWSPFSKKMYNGVAVMITFLFVTVGWYFFHYSTDDIKQMVKKEIFHQPIESNKPDEGV